MQPIRNKLLELNTWKEFFSYANFLREKEKGDAFEFLTKMILTTKPEYNSLIKNVWLQGEVPNDISIKLNLPSRDEGIDLIAETYQEDYWAVQCKFKGQNQAPTYKELSTFTHLANTYCKNISLALLVHTGERGVRKKYLLGEKYSEIGLEFWLGLKSEDWSRIHNSLRKQSIRPEPRIPRPHQQKAILGAYKHYVKNKAIRGRLIMPCGSGKSLAAFWVADTLKAKSVVIAVPSLSLIKQSLEDWTREFLALKEDPLPEWLVICSDESTARLEKDEFVSDAYSLGIPTTTNFDEICSFLSKKYNGRKIVFTTYQSSARLALATRKSKFSFDLAILDEAHKTVGIKSKAFATLLLDKNIQAGKRVFMTATEKIFRGDDDDVLSMDDTSIYGDLFYQLTFKEAIHSSPPIICDYKVLTISVTNSEIEQLIANNELITDNVKNLEEQESQSLASAIALRKAIQNYGIKHTISFHKSIKGADSFSKLNRTLNNGNLDNVFLNSFHISSKKSAGERARLMDGFTEENPALITNARCLTEGVDIPSIDCVLFADPKQSIVDIVQSSGRALRPFAGKEFGYIMLPLIIPDNILLEEFTESTPFKEVIRIITALSTQDEMIAEEFRTIAAGKLSKGGKIIIDSSIPAGLKLDLKDFIDSINAKIWERVAKVNWRPFFEARVFVHGLNIKNDAEWRKYCQSGEKPEDIPVNPNNVYKNKGWVSIGDWLGTGTISNLLKEFRPFEEAREFVHLLKLKSQTGWNKYYTSGKKPEDIPSNPAGTYAGLGWAGMGDWLGTGAIATRSRKYLPFKDAKQFIHNLNLKGSGEWRKYLLSGDKPDNIPAHPDRTYSGKGWIGMGDWLGTGTIAPRLREYRSFSEAKEYVLELNLKNQKAWLEYCKTGKKPDDIPSNPQRTYQKKGWSGFGDWLGTGIIANRYKKYRQFKEARIFVREFGFKNRAEWKEYCKSGKKPEDIPSNPNQIYKTKGWAGMGDWLGTGTIAPGLKEYRSFSKAKEYVLELNLKNQKAWLEYCKSGKKPDDIPADPAQKYLGKGWAGMGDWLGTGTIAPGLKEYRSFAEAREFVHKLNFKSTKDWKRYCQSGEKPEDIPSVPYNSYRSKGWVSFGDWLGTGFIATYLREYRSFQESKAFVHELGFSKWDDWLAYTKSGNKPEDIPNDPAGTYSGKGWIGVGDWLGTGNIAPRFRQYRRFDEARAFVHDLKLRNAREWTIFSKSGEKPQDIPSSPIQVYKDKGWVNWGDWLGTGTTSNKLREYRPFNEARKFVHKLKLKRQADWIKYYKSGEKPKDIPSNPARAYFNDGWVNMGDWLGTGTIASFLREYRSFEEARAYVKELGLKSVAEWKEYCKSGKNPPDIPKNPDGTYKEKGWAGIGDWLGTGTIAPRLREYRSFKDAREFVHRLNLKSGSDWKKYCKSGKKPDNIPAKPDNGYKDKGWAGMGDWLGTGTIAPGLKEYRNFNEAKAFVHKFRLKKWDEWLAYCRSGKKPDDIPASPDRVYKDKGWIGVGDWLGTGNIASRYKKFRSFYEARSFVRGLNLKSQADWNKYYKLGEKPKDIPSNPAGTYEGKGWAGMGDWLGTGTIPTRSKKYCPFQEARTFVHELGLNSHAEWRTYCKSGKKPDDIPAKPERTYLDKGWLGVSDWLGKLK